MAATVKSLDDFLHTPGTELDWRESYYFNFVSHDEETAGFTTIGVLPNRRRAEFVLFLFSEGKQTTYYKEQELAIDLQSHAPLSNGTLTYAVVESMQTWKIDFFDEKLDLRLEWRARFPPFDFGEGSGTSWLGHFEQSGTVEGEAEFPDGRKIHIGGYGQRDKSWGPRNWHIEKWFALHTQFEKYNIGLRKDMVKGISHVSGGLSSSGRQLAASEVEVYETFGEGDDKIPVGALTTIRYVNGENATILSKLIAPKSYAKFRRDFSQGSTELFEGMAVHENTRTGERGTGLIEFLTTYPNP